MPSQPVDAPENLTKEGPSQVTFSELQREVPRVPDQPSAVLSNRCCRLVSDQDEERVIADGLGVAILRGDGLGPPMRRWRYPALAPQE
jgi:hypothetical protein